MAQYNLDKLIHVCKYLVCCVAANWLYWRHGALVAVTYALGALIMNATVQNANLDLDFNEAWAYIGLRERDRIRAKAELARADFLVDLLAGAANTLAKQAGALKDGVVNSLVSWFSHCQDRTFS
jgi:hypothetical protein